MASESMRLPDLLPGERSDALSISALYGRVQAAIGRAMPRARPLWVRGEIQSVTDRTGHCYLELVDPDLARSRDTPVLKVNCWARTWAPLKVSLERQGVVLEPGLVVTLQGRVELYAPRGQLNFIATDVDVTALLGRMAARRAALLAALESEGLLLRNRALAVPELPLRIGLVASRGTEGYRDFTGQIFGSGFGFKVLHASAHVQGSGAPRQIAAALSALFAKGCDLAVVVRGGGSKADLAAFDSEPVARAIASAPVPVWTGIGHTGDQSVADVVANRAFVTPTECGQELVARVTQWWSAVTRATGVVAKRAAETIADASQRDQRARTRLCASARNQLDRHAERLEVRAARIATHAPRSMELASTSILVRSSRLGPAALERLGEQGDRIVSWRRLIGAYDVERQLERGYTLTLDQGGRLVRSVVGMAPGTRLSTMFADGTAHSEVTDVEAGR
ncbi:MAG TPA: exodeoxyribonuclease VII large subunit [Acidimicrobiales bacterium]|nr:exodeoxyribonuclease VII large subunit [Acidimicrobiales bacterium]